MPVKSPQIDINALLDDPNFAKVARKYANLAPQYKAVLQKITPDSAYLQKQMELLKMADQKELYGKKIDVATEELNLNKDIYGQRLDLIKAKNAAADEVADYKLGLLSAKIGAESAESTGKLDLARMKLGYDIGLDAAKLDLVKAEIGTKAYDSATRRLKMEGANDLASSGNLVNNLLGIGNVIASAYGAYNKYNTANSLAQYGYGLNGLF